MEIQIEDDSTQPMIPPPEPEPIDEKRRRLFNRLHHRNCCGLEPNIVILDCLQWSFDTTFLKLILVGLLWYFSLILLFAIFIAIMGANNPDCFTPEYATETGRAFNDAFTLSWTTFSTVGYGSIYPTIPDDSSDRGGCVGLSLLTSAEAFIGVLFTSIIGSLFFGKVLRVQSTATVKFSDVMVLRFIDNYATPNSQCPVLEFRILNTAFNKRSSEILSAELDCVVMQEQEQPLTENGHEERSTNDSQHIQESSDGTYMRMSSGLERDESINEYTYFNDPNPEHHSKTSFTKLVIGSANHPFLKDIWTIQHIMDETSPLLSRRIRDLITRNGGHWPSEFRAEDTVRDSLVKSTIGVTLSGIANSSATSVYANFIYDLGDDLKIGCQFANIHSTDNDGNYVIDKENLSKVWNQNYVFM